MLEVRDSLTIRLFLFVAAVTPSAWGTGVATGNEPKHSLFDRSNLVAWCVVPFDSKQRTSAERAEMLAQLGIKRLAYDYRNEHIPTFDEEINQLEKFGIELFAWWFPTTLNDEAKHILSVLENRNIQTQLWVTGFGEMDLDSEQEAQFLESEVKRIAEIAEAAARIGCSVGLYNHGGWFGEPENQVRIIDRLKDRGIDNVGIVYNLHHGHHHLARLSELIETMKPHLMAFNLNGMKTDGDQLGFKILPIGEGDQDLKILRTLVASGLEVPIGILNHTDEDAEARLRDNLDGLEWLLKLIDHEQPIKPAASDPPAPPPPKPTWRSFSGLPTLDDHLIKDIVRRSELSGDAARGLRLFASQRVGCLTCHKLGQSGGEVGPELTQISDKRNAVHLVRSLLLPQLDIDAEYQAERFLLENGSVRVGYILSDTPNEVQIRDASTNEIVSLDKADILEQQTTGSVMPNGVVSNLSHQDQLDLIALMMKLGKSEHFSPEVINEIVPHLAFHAPASFPIELEPLFPDLRPAFREPINVDRMYDFYTKQAIHFRTQASHATLLEAFHGLNGKKYGHWGNQDEASWAGDAWNHVRFDGFVSNVVLLPQQTVARGIVCRLDDSAATSLCYDIDSMQFVAAWEGGFVEFSSVRNGFMDGVRPVGTPIDPPPRLELPSNAKYLGLYRFELQSLMAVEVDGDVYLDSITRVNGAWQREFASLATHSLRSCVEGGKPLWGEPLQTAIEQGDHRPYSVDTIHVPQDNPFNIPLYLGGIAFAPDGTLYVCTMHGDVWQVVLDEEAADPRAYWRRFASGLHHPLGLLYHDGTCFVLGRNQITRLHDLNGDGEADFYESFSRAMETSPAGHDYICGLERDDEGNFYTASGNQGLLRISPDGSTASVLANGFRNPDGLGLYPNGWVTVPCSEGEWTPTSMICLVKPESEQTGKPPFFGYGGPNRGGPPELPLVYLPRGIDNSSGGQVFVDSDRWGPLQGQMIHLSYGATTSTVLFVDEVDGQHQGGVVLLPGEFRSGVHRGRFSPVDGQLYLAGMQGWGTYAPDDGSLQRYRYNPDDLPTVVGFHVHENGIALKFSQSLNEASLETAKSITDRLNEPDCCFVQAWNYRYSSAYGSAEYSPSQPRVRGHDRWFVKNLHLLDGGRTLFIELPDLQPVNQVHIQLELFGTRIPIDFFGTVHWLDRPRTDLPSYQAISKTWSVHPMQRDLAELTGARENPFRHVIDDARTIHIAAGQNLTYSVSTLTAKPGEALRLVFSNPDVVPHNWALLTPGSLNQVGEMCNRLISDPDAAVRHYIPDTDAVLFYTNIVDGKEETEIYFHAPETPGRYPFACTFPGHWMVMNGMMMIE